MGLKPNFGQPYPSPKPKARAQPEPEIFDPVLALHFNSELYCRMLSRLHYGPPGYPGRGGGPHATSTGQTTASRPRQNPPWGQCDTPESEKQRLIRPAYDLPDFTEPPDVASTKAEEPAATFRAGKEQSSMKSNHSLDIIPHNSS